MGYIRRLLIVIALLAIALLTVATESLGEQAKPIRVAVNNTAQLSKLVGQQVTAHGKVSRATKSKGGHHFLNFYSSNLAVVCFKEDAAKFSGGGPATLFRDKEVEVTGKLELYKGKPQIKLRLPKQIQLAKASTVKQTDPSSASQASPTKKFELKQIGKSTWLSPSGLKYKGLDAQGLTRVEHVLRHAKDQPNRAGSHGVFDGDDDQALAVVDEAWKLAKRRKSNPRTKALAVPTRFPWVAASASWVVRPANVVIIRP